MNRQHYWFNELEFRSDWLETPELVDTFEQIRHRIDPEIRNWRPHRGKLLRVQRVGPGGEARANGGAVWATGLATSSAAARSTPSGFLPGLS